MTAGKLNKYWMMAAILLIIIIVSGGIVVWLRYRPGQPVEITMPPGKEIRGTIYIGGAATNPGFYPFADGDSLGALIRAAGGTTANADLEGVKLYIPGTGEEEEAQKIDINRAEVWLLKALPGIGETLAQRIVDYRRQNGPFRNTRELTGVAGIGDSTYEQIKHLITVAE